MSPFTPFRFKFQSFGSGWKPRSTRGISTRSTPVCDAVRSQVSVDQGKIANRDNEGAVRSGSRPKYRSVRRGPGKHWLSKPPVIFRGEREICNPATAEGRAEYKRRIILMWIRQDGLCCIGGESIHLRDATFEHEGLRGMGGAKRDDRITDSKGRPMNGVACLEHNSQKGSRRWEIEHGNNHWIELNADLMEAE